METTRAAEIVSPDWFDLLLHWTSRAIEVCGVAVIALGVVVAAAAAIRILRAGHDWSAAYHAFRTSLARGILLGLEFLVAADIIGTVAVEPTLDNLTVLGLIVLIRTFLSFSLEVEIDGRWPWQKATEPSPGP
ncbi:DUF1622 domain-containing protein [Faunimonas sp. B44]|uniref:DUF1622 domain-containing protein n=1 Tax=Faunimonas sp. B44 TaxID=3461493 RepID=UPI0040448FF9